MPSSMLLMTVSRRSRSLRTSPTRPVTESAMVLNSRASQETVSAPSAGTRCARSPPAISRAVVSKRCSRRSTNTRTTIAISDDEDEGERRRAPDQPAQVAVHVVADPPGVEVEQHDAVDAVGGLVAAVAGLAVPKGDHRAQDRLVPAVSMTWLESRFSGGRRWQAWQVCGAQVEPRRLPSGVAGEAHDALAVEEHDLRDARLLPEALHHPRDQAAVVLHHLVLERRADQLALREGGAPLGGDQRPEVVDRVEVRAGGAGDRHRGGDADGEAGRHARQTACHSEPVGEDGAIVADGVGVVND